MLRKQMGEILTGAIVTVAIVAGFLSLLWLKKEDNPIEETAEYVVESQLNLPKGSLDLSPNSPE